MSLKDVVAIVTGGNSGIGKAISVRPAEVGASIKTQSHGDGGVNGRCAPPCGTPSSFISWSHCGPDGAVSTGWQSWGAIQAGSGDGASLRSPRDITDDLVIVERT